MAATHVMSSPAMAVAPHTPVSSSLPSSSPAANLSSKKQEHLNAGRRRLEEFKQKQRQKNKVPPATKQNKKEAAGQVLPNFHADVGEAVGEPPSNSEANFGSNTQNFDKRECSNGEMVLDIKGATASPVLPIEQLYTDLRKSFFPQKPSERRDPIVSSPNVEFQLNGRVVIDENNSFLQPFSGRDSFLQSYPSPETPLPKITNVGSDDAHTLKNLYLGAKATSGSMSFSESPSTTMKQDPSNVEAASILEDGRTLEPNGIIVQSLQTKVTRCESDHLFDIPRHKKQQDGAHFADSEGNGSWFEKKSGVQDHHVGIPFHTDATHFSSRNEFVIPTIQHTTSEVVFSRQEAPSSRGFDGPSSNPSSLLPFASFRPWNLSSSHSAQHESVSTNLISKFEHNEHSRHSDFSEPLLQFQRPFEVSTVTAHNTPFSPPADSLFSQEPSKITGTPLGLLKSPHEVDGDNENNAFLSHSLAVADEVDHLHIGDKFSTAGSLEKLRPSLERSDEFASLEQHIEDLTQEKFALQRGLDSARMLAESLAQENSAFAEDFNQQGDLIAELKAEVEKQQSELLAQTLKANHLKLERDKAQQESISAVERSQAFAAEVVSLEERILKVRSQELKLEKEVKELVSENQSQKSQISSMEKDRTNLKSMIEALQEEKKVLQSRLRKATNDLEDVKKPSKETADASSQDQKVDASTSTIDLALESTSTKNVPALVDSTSSFNSLAQTQSALIGSTSQDPNNLHVPSPWSSIPSEQLRKVENINMLITELAEEKEALRKTLKAESAVADELRALNSELSRKLELQTQQLELAVAQRMAHNGTPMNRNIYSASAAGPEFVDEGDEVVERVLGWIMKLFPGGASRRGSKRL